MKSQQKQKLRLFDFDDFSRQALTFHHCQSGYHPRSVKRIVVWSLRDMPELRYRLVDAATAKPVKTGRCEKKGENTWGRIDWIVDLSDFRREGAYVLEVQGGGKPARSPEFRIDPQCYEILLEKSAKHLFVKRCGVCCHGHDGDIRSLEQKDFGRLLGRKDVHGGWHDAHDDNKWIGSVWNVIYGLCEVHDRLRPSWKGTNEPLPYALAEAWWEVEFLLRAQKDDGSIYFGIFEWYPEHDGKQWVNRIHTELNHYDDLARDRRLILDEWNPSKQTRLFGWAAVPDLDEKFFYGHRSHAYLAASIARFARAVAKYDKAIAKRCLAAVKKILKFLRSRECPETQFMDSQSGLALTKMELSKLTGSAALLREAEEHLRQVLSLQQAEGYFRSSPGVLGLEMESLETQDPWYVSSFPYSYGLSLVRYIDDFPRGRLREQVRQSLRRFVDFACGFTRQTSFGQLVQMTLSSPPLIIRRGSSGAHCLSMASLLLAAGRMFKDSKYTQAGEANIQWMFGANPRAMSFMVDEGYRNIGQYVAFHNGVSHDHFAWYNHTRDDRWGMSTGIRGTAGIPDQPDNYPNAGDSMHKRYNHFGQEAWLLVTGWFLMAGTELAESLREGPAPAAKKNRTRRGLPAGARRTSGRSL